MTPERWEEICRAFEEALAQPEAERAGFLKERYGQDPELLAEVESLLSTPSDRLEEVMATTQEILAAPKGDFQPGDRLGPYEIEALVGTGGMSRVYAAERVDGRYQRRVAIKVLQRTSDAARILRRYRSERQILAHLTHENLAQFYDDGMTDDGRPYLVMELVEGTRIDEYCSQHRLSLRARLKLFRDVCLAVQFAHQNLVIHRDLKPSNILVTSEGVPKLLDFGIAKVLTPGGEEDATLTPLLLQQLTPEYASPEQILGTRLGTATDVYSLGVLLYLLLVDRRPYSLHGYGFGELSTKICSEPPASPSAALAASDPSPGGDGAPSREPVPWNASKLQGDLDAIVLKALRKEPERRYTSAQQFADDLSRYLDGLPVAARPDSLSYRARKFIQRHPAAVLATTLVLVLSLVFGGLMTWQRNVATSERDRAREATRFLVSLFKTADPQQMKASELSALALLDEGSRLLLTSDEMEVQLRAELMSSVASVFVDLELPKKALPLHERALELMRQEGGEQHPELGEQLSNLAVAHYLLGDLDQAEEFYRRSLEHLNRTLRDVRDPRHASIRNNLATLLLAKGQTEAAEDLFREALQRRKAIYPADHDDILQGKNNLATVLNYQSRFAEAEVLFREVLGVRETKLGQEDRKFGASLHNLGWNLSSQGKYEEALVYQERALEVDLATLDLPHASAARTYINLCGTLESLRRLEESERHCREAVEMLTQLYGNEHPDTAIALHNLARTLFTAGRYDEALEVCEESFKTRREVLPPEHPFIAHSISLMAEIKEAQGDLVQAEALHRESLEHRRRSSGEEDHIDLLNGLEKLGYFLLRTNSRGEGVVLLREATLLVDRLLSPGSDRTQALRQALSSAEEENE